MPKIIFDTAIGSSNLGDHIIMDAVHPILEELFEDEFLLQIATHQRIHPLDLPSLRSYDLAVVGGTNLLKNDNLRYSQWKVGPQEMLVLKNKVLLLGVGWWQYQKKPVSGYSRALYKSLLSHRFQHSVRDQYTKEKLASIGIRNVINTGCPTVWMLDEAHCAGIDTSRKKKVVTTITDYLRDPERDRQMLEILQSNYEEVHLWLQGSQDLKYVQSLIGGLHYIAPKLSAFDRFLEEEDCDYVGTRLHAGIRALQYKRRALIIGIDNRALEMRRDIGLPVLERTQIHSLPQWIEQEAAIELKVDQSAIAAWKTQFTNQKA